MKNLLYRSCYVFAFLFTLGYIGRPQYARDSNAVKGNYYIDVRDGYNIIRTSQAYARQQDSISTAIFGYNLSAKADRVALDSLMSKVAFEIQFGILNQRVSTVKDSVTQNLFLNGNVLSISRGNTVTLPFLTSVPGNYMKYPDTMSLSARIDAKQPLGAYLTTIPSFYMKYSDTASLSARIDGKQAVGNYALVSQIPTNTNQLVNGAAFITASALSGYALITQIPTSTNQLANNSGFLTSAPVSSVNSLMGSVVLTTSNIAEGGRLYYTDARSIAAPLTGLATGTNTPVVAGNTVIGAMQNLQAQINAINGNMSVNTTGVGLSKATLNSTYPGTGVGFMVLCPNITLGGAIYVRATTGASGTWQLISAPPVL